MTTPVTPADRLALRTRLLELAEWLMSITPTVRLSPWKRLWRTPAGAGGPYTDAVWVCDWCGTSKHGVDPDDTPTHPPGLTCIWREAVSGPSDTPAASWPKPKGNY